MSAPAALLFVEDDAVRQAIRFALEVEGIPVWTCTDRDALKTAAIEAGTCLVLDLTLDRDGSLALAMLKDLRASGIIAPAIVLASTPTAHVREMAANDGAMLVEKPLLCDVLKDAIRSFQRKQDQC